MPEGDTIYRTAVRLRKSMEGCLIEDAGFHPRYSSPVQLIGQRVDCIEARGKHLLMFTDQDRVIHSHLGMTGSWHLYASHEAWRKPETYAHLWLKMANGDEAAREKTDCGNSTDLRVVVCFTPKILEVLTRTELKRHPWINRLGPDLLANAPDIERIRQRFRTHNQTPIGEAIMNQSIMCGVGNVYKSEALFVCRIDPFAKVTTLDDDQLRELSQTSRKLMLRNLAGYPRRTRSSLNNERVWVYGRSGKPCLNCGDRIQMTRQGDLGRSTYFCPTCQQSG